jgi:hypothetical protein
MTPLIRPYFVTNCQVCGNLVPEANLSEHILADARILQIIKATHPDWTREECEDYLKSFAGGKDGMGAPAETVSLS